MIHQTEFELSSYSPPPSDPLENTTSVSVKLKAFLIGRSDFFAFVGYWKKYSCQLLH